MKKTLFILIAAITLNIGHVMASDSENTEPKSVKVLTNQIYKMLGEKDIPDEIRGYKAEVRIAVDNGNYLRILSVETENDALETYIRSRIDFQKLKKDTFEQGIIYRIPIEVRK